jgi:hypothetical protein
VLAVIAAGLLLVLTLGSPFESTNVGRRVLFFILATIQLNVLLALSNMVPVPPLDGGLSRGCATEPNPKSGRWYTDEHADRIRSIRSISVTNR